LHCIKSPNQPSLLIKLKIITSPLFETKFESESFTILFYSSSLTLHVGYIQMIVNVPIVTKNVCMSRHWKAELVAYEIHLQSL
jgi:hypothetical protein